MFGRNDTPLIQHHNKSKKCRHFTLLQSANLAKRKQELSGILGVMLVDGCQMKIPKSNECVEYN